MQQKTAAFVQRHNLSTIWAQYNPILQTGELGFETDTGILRLGDGVTFWNDLDQISIASNPTIYKAGQGLIFDEQSRQLSASLLHVTTKKIKSLDMLFEAINSFNFDTLLVSATAILSVNLNLNNSHVFEVQNNINIPIITSILISQQINLNINTLFSAEVHNATVFNFLHTPSIVAQLNIALYSHKILANSLQFQISYIWQVNKELNADIVRIPNFFYQKNVTSQVNQIIYARQVYKLVLTRYDIIQLLISNTIQSNCVYPLSLSSSLSSFGGIFNISTTVCGLIVNSKSLLNTQANNFLSTSALYVQNLLSVIIDTISISHNFNINIHTYILATTSNNITFNTNLVILDNNIIYNNITYYLNETYSTNCHANIDTEIGIFASGSTWKYPEYDIDNYLIIYQAHEVSSQPDGTKNWTFIY